MHAVGPELLTHIYRKRVAGLNIHGFSPLKFSWKSFCDALASSAYYLTIAKYTQEPFCNAVKNHKNCKSLAQQIVPHSW